MRRARRIQTGMTLGLVLLGPVLTAATLLALGPMKQGASSPALRLILLADLIYILVVAALVIARIARMVADRRAHSAGSRLHLRLTGIFAIVALVPTILVAVFAVLTVNIGLEGWFSDRVRNVVGSSLAAAQAYEEEHRQDLIEDTVKLAQNLNLARERTFFMRDEDARPVLTHGQAQIQRGLREVYLIDGTGALMTRGERSYLFDFEHPTAEQIAQADAGETVVIEDWPNNEYRALIKLNAFNDRYLYVSREVDGKILSLLDQTQATVRLYHQLENDRGRLLFEFGLLYLGFAIILILAAVWLGLWFAERLAGPIGRLAQAAAKVGEGDLEIRVVEEQSDDEIALMGRVFNRMTRQLKAQREALVSNHRQSDEQRRLFDSVLSNVTAGVIGVAADGTIQFFNRSGRQMLDLAPEAGGTLADLAPEFAPMFDRLRENNGGLVQEELRLTRHGRLESLLVRMSSRRSDTGALEGYVVAFDDVTDLVSAQRMAAWGDVARRIAHEIKNPLTPIQLSAERIRRKFGKQIAEPADLEQYTDVIIRQTNDLRRIVDEFSKFARMPEPDRRENDLVELLRNALVLQEAGQPGVRFHSDLPGAPVLMELDATMIGQALTNLIKNAGEATESLIENGAKEGYVPVIRVTMTHDEQQAIIRIMDNGIGLPVDRARLFEPYVTTRAKGTGLGLPIVKKIIEEHGGTLSLLDAPVFAENTHVGAMAEIVLPKLASRRWGRNGAGSGQGSE